MDFTFGPEQEELRRAVRGWLEQRSPAEHLRAMEDDALGTTAEVRFKDPVPGDMPQTYADISKARALLGYQPAVSIEVGIPRFVAWYRSTRTT